MKIKLTHHQQRALTVAVIFGLLFGFYFMRNFLSLIVVGAIMAYLFYPLRQRLLKKLKRPGVATSITLIVAFFSVVIPLTAITYLTVIQIESLLKAVPQLQVGDVGSSGRAIVKFINNFLGNFPGDRTVSGAGIINSLQGFAKNASQGFLNFILASVGGIPKFFTEIIMFIFIFASFLNSGEKIIAIIRRINPLGPKLTDMYLQKMGDMTKAVVKGQFIIAFCQGLIGAGSLYIAGWHSVFFFMLLILTLLSIIPLGSGILTIPIGILMIALGNYWQGIMIILVHIIIITNIDNFLRAQLVPKSAHLNSALMILAVFGGLEMFGFIGIVIGPVIMILILSTIDVYLKVKDTNGEAELEATD